MKKDSSVIRNRQLHHLTLPGTEGFEEQFLAAFPGALDPGNCIFHS